MIIYGIFDPDGVAMVTSLIDPDDHPFPYIASIIDIVMTGQYAVKKPLKCQNNASNCYGKSNYIMEVLKK